MKYIGAVVDVISGTPQFRIAEDLSADAPVYCFYSQADLEADLRNLPSEQHARKKIKTFDEVVVTSPGEVVFSLLSGTASIVRAERSGYLLTQNYVKLVPFEEADACYLAYVLNEDKSIRRQLRMGKQGSATMKHTLAQINSLKLPSFPSREKQRLIGGLYFNQLELEARKKRASQLETAIVLETIRKANQSWTS